MGEFHAPADAKAVADDGKAGKRHGCCRDHGIEKGERRQRYGRNVIEKRPEHILLDGPERDLRQFQRLHDFGGAAFHEDDLARLDRNVGPGANGDAEVRLR
jgi:hypothetical protein